MNKACVTLVREARTNSCDFLLWTPLHGYANVGWPTRTYLRKLCMDTRCSPEDLFETIDDRDEWWERESGKSVLAMQLDDDIYIFMIMLLQHIYCYDDECLKKYFIYQSVYIHCVSQPLKQSSSLTFLSWLYSLYLFRLSLAYSLWLHIFNQI